MSKVVLFLIVLSVAAGAPAAEPPTLRAVIDGMEARDARIFDIDVDYAIETRHLDPFYVDMKAFVRNGRQTFPMRIANLFETMDRVHTVSVHFMASGKSYFYEEYEGAGKDRKPTYEYWYDGRLLGALNLKTLMGGISGPPAHTGLSCPTVPLFLGLRYLELPAFLKQLDLTKSSVTFDSEPHQASAFTIDSIYNALPSLSITTRDRIEVDPSHDNWPTQITEKHITNDTGRSDAYLDSQVTVDQFTQSDGVSYPQTITVRRFYLSSLETVTTLTVDHLAINSGLPPRTFACQFPPGSGVYDSVRHVGYTVGDSPAKIDEALAEAAKTKAFYDALFAKPPPALQASQWLVGNPLSLAQIKNRPVILHFWNIGCGPCVAAIPQLEQQYGRTLSNDNGPLFISIYSYCDGDDLARAKAFIKEKGITFPVVLDAADPDGSSWGLTNKAYGIDRIPQDATIDATGRLESVGDYVRQ
jgi:hypothetical protein